METLTATFRQVSGTRLAMLEGGRGPTLLFLHGDEGPTTAGDRYLRLLAENFRVIAPWHPGFGQSERPRDLRTVSDLAYLYLDLAESEGLADAYLVGSSFGAWIAIDMAIKSRGYFDRLALAGPLGIKVGDRTTRDIADMFALSPDEWIDFAYVNPGLRKRAVTEMSDEELTASVRSREALAHFGWQPYMHDPQLRQWLHRIRIPTLVVRGAQDRVVRETLHHAIVDAIPGCRFLSVPDAGHFPHFEQPARFAEIVRDFASVRSSGPIAAVRPTP